MTKATLLDHPALLILQEGNHVEVFVRKAFAHDNQVGVHLIEVPMPAQHEDAEAFLAFDLGDGRVTARRDHTECFENEVPNVVFLEEDGLMTVEAWVWPDGDKTPAFSMSMEIEETMEAHEAQQGGQG